MRMFKRISIGFVICFLLCFLVTGFQVWNDLSTREDEMLSYVRLAVKNAAVNTQSTEVAQDRLTHNYIHSSYITPHEFLTEKNKIGDYLDRINYLIFSTGGFSSASRSAIQFFCEYNEDAIYNTTTGASTLFNPIQYGMTYIDKDAFTQSLTEYISSMIEANYGETNQAYTRVTDALHLDNVQIDIDGPKVCKFDSSNEIYRELYGITDEINDLAPDEDLGFAQSAIDFFVYYDIEVTVDWSSATANQMFTKQYLEGIENITNAALKYTPGERNYVYIPGKTITYNYRYAVMH